MQSYRLVSQALPKVQQFEILYKFAQAFKVAAILNLSAV